MADIEGPEQLPLESNSSESGHISLRPDVMTVTVPTDDERHMVTRDQIELLCRGGKDQSFDWCLFLFGIGAGLFQNLLSVGLAYWGRAAPDGKDVFLALICIGCLAAGMAKLTEHRRNHSDTDELKERMIKGRKVHVK